MADNIATFVALIIATFYFIVIQFYIETLLNFIIDSDSLLWVFITIIFSIFSLGFIFIFYYVARYIEEFYANKNDILRIVFYYIIPVIFYLAFNLVLKHKQLKINFFVVICVSFVIKQIMEFFFKKLIKKPLKNY